MRLTSKQKSFLDNAVKGKWSINTDTGLVDVEGSVFMSGSNFTKIPIKFGNVTGCFDCSNNKLTSLIGSPQSVGVNFYCYRNQLTSLIGSPQSIGDDFYCHRNELTSLVGAPQLVFGDFNCTNNKLKTLVGAPQSVGIDFYCYRNQLTSLEGAPQSVGGFFLIDLGDISKDYYHAIIPQIEEMIENGIELHDPNLYYYSYKKAYYNNKLIEIL
jgi:hypothetical protein